MECKIQIGLVVESLIVLRHYKQLQGAIETSSGMMIFPRGYKKEDLERVMNGLEEVKVTAKELMPQLRVQ